MIDDGTKDDEIVTGPSTINGQKPWWVWLLMYPAVLVAIINGGYDLVKEAIPIASNSNSEGAHAFRELIDPMYETKTACYAHVDPTLITDGEQILELIPCGIHGVWLTFVGSEGARSSHWIENEKEVAGARLSLISKSYANTSILSKQKTISQILQDSKKISKIISRNVDSNGNVVVVRRLSETTCVEEIVNPSTGKIISRRKYSC